MRGVCGWSMVKLAFSDFSAEKLCGLWMQGRCAVLSLNGYVRKAGMVMCMMV